MPPSLGGTRRWVITSKPLSRSPFQRQAQQQCVLEHAAGQCDGCVAGAAPWSARFDDRVGHGVVEPRPDHPGRHASAHGRATTAASTGAGSITAG